MLFKFLLNAAILAICLTSAKAQRDYTVVNNCPIDIDLYIAGAKDLTLAQGANTTKSLGVNAGFFYTDANGGSADGQATRAGFYSDGQVNYFYLVKDVDHFNTGLRIFPSYSSINGTCFLDTCDSVDCTTAFDEPPTHITPTPGGGPPNPPMYSCPHSDVTYRVIFCPSGTLPGQ